MAVMNATHVVVVLILLLLSICDACPRRARERTKGFTSLSLGVGTSSLGNTNTTTKSTLGVLRRWYSIWSLAEIGAGQSEHGTDITKYDYGPWPKKCGQTWVRYCFKDAGSADRLLSIVAHAIAYWGPLGRYSSMKIQPDIACFDASTNVYEYRCICGTQANTQTTDNDAVHISDGRDGSENEDDWEKDTYSKTGYDYTSEEDGRHVLVFGHFNRPRTAGWSDAKNAAEDYRAMAHEFGHTMGLDHEHQRPDFADFLDWHPEYIDGYKEAQGNVMKPGAMGFDASDDVNQRMTIVCTNLNYAEHYFPNLLDYLDGRLSPQGTQQEYASDSEPFDYSSIMIYSSTSLSTEANSAEDTDADAKFPILKKNADGSPPTEPGNLVWQGGCDGILQNVRISAYDIKRIAALYPGTAAQQAAASRLGGARGSEMVNWEPGSYSIPGLVQRLDLRPNPLRVAWLDENGKLLPDIAPQAAAADPDALAADITAMAIGDEEVEGSELQGWGGSLS